MVTLKNVTVSMKNKIKTTQNYLIVNEVTESMEVLFSRTDKYLLIFFLLVISIY